MPHLCGLDSLLSTSGTSGRSNFPTATQPPWPFTFAKIGLSVQTWQAVGSLKGMNHAHSLVCCDTITRRLTPASTMPRFTDSEGTVEDVVIEYLRNVDPSTGSSPIESALEIYISKLDETSKNRILPGWIRLSEIYEKAAPKNPKNPRKRKRKPSGSDEESLVEDGELRRLQEKAKVFLNCRETKRARETDRQMKPVNPLYVEGSIAALYVGQRWHDKNDIGKLWSEKDPPEQIQSTTPIRRLAMLYNRTSSAAHSVVFRKRILKVLWLHECKQNGIQISKEESTEMEEKTGLSLGKATVVDKAARHWLTIIEAWGIGSLVMPGAGNCYLFERELTKDQVEDLWAFCGEHMSHIKLRVQIMRETVLRLFVEAMEIYKGDAGTLTEGQGRLAEAYRTNSDLFMIESSVPTSDEIGDTRLSLKTCPQNPAFDTQDHMCSTQFRADSPQNSPAGLQVLADAAANRVDPSRSGPTSAGDQDQSRRDTQAQQTQQTQQQLRVWNDGPIAGQVSRLASYGMDFTSTATYGQDMLSPWRMYANQDPGAFQGAPAGPHTSIATADQVQINAPRLSMDTPQHQLSDATPDTVGVDPQACEQSVQPQWLPDVQAHQSTMLNPALADSLVYFSEGEIARANDSEAITANMNDLWPAEWFDEMLDQDVREKEWSLQ